MASGGPELRQFHEALQRLQAWGQAQPAAQPAGAGAAQRLRLPELVSLRGFLPLALGGLTADTPPPVALELKVQQAHASGLLQYFCSDAVHVSTNTAQNWSLLGSLLK
jgi:hypothetical protein